MRYFLSINASRPTVAGGFTFTFEPVQNRGGSWLGVLAVEEDSTASTLAGSGAFGVEEISFDRYDGLKKKVSPVTTSTSASPLPRRVRTPGDAVEGVRLVEQRARAPGVGNPLIPRREAPAAPPTPVESVSLQSTTAQPPSEPLLEAPQLRPARRVARKDLAA